MSDINAFANERLLEFLDAVHGGIESVLRTKFGEDWLRDGVQRHLAQGYFERAREMLSSPMRVVDMSKSDDELFGVEHLWNIVNGNWELFAAAFGDKTRTQVYFGEIAELRHNVSHRRQRHLLRRVELARFLHNCRMLLAALGSPLAESFGAVAEAISAGGNPWATSLASSLPPHEEVFDEFIGRPKELRELSEWLVSDSRQHVVWGYGGAGKSATAYQFALDVRDAVPPGIEGVVWVSAKRREYVDGAERDRRSDFQDLSSFLAATMKGLYGDLGPQHDLNPSGVVSELNETPVLLIVDDLDSVLENDELTSFLLYDLRATRSKFLFTSRQKLPGIKTTEIEGFESEELKRFIKTRAKWHGLDQEACAAKMTSIRSVTSGFPLFVDDLLRYARLVGLNDALSAWSQRQGDAARLYSLQRQLDHLGQPARDALIAIAVADRPLTSVEIAQVSGSTDDDVDHALKDLLAWRLVNRVAGAQESRPGFDMNANTRRLVGKSFRADPRIAGYRTVFRSLSGESMPAAKRQAIGSAINVARALVLREEIDQAIEQLKASMTGDLASAPDLHGALGWVYSRAPERFLNEAREAFHQSHIYGSRKEDTYYQWSAMERELAEENTGKADDAAVAASWHACAEIAQLGIDRLGPTKVLCNMAGYARSREAKTNQRLNQFVDAERCFGEAVAYFRRGIGAPSSESRTVPQGVLFKGWALACEGLEDIPGMAAALREWRDLDPEDDYYSSERDRLAIKFPSISSLMKQASS